MSTNGKWLASTSEEHWNSHEEWDTREEALAYAITELAEQDDLEDEQRVYTGQIGEITADDLAGTGVRADRVIEDINERLYELVGEASEDAFNPSAEDETDLERRLTDAIRGWMVERNVKPRCYNIDHVKSEIWHRCAKDAAGERCSRHLDHPGDCDSLALWTLKNAEKAAAES